MPEPGDDVGHDGAKHEAKRFVRAMAGFYLAILVLLIAFSVYTNPWADFGPAGLHGMQNARLTKTDFVDAQRAEERHPAYVLGSSTVMRFTGDAIEREFGLRSFNYGVFWGRAEDFYTIGKHLLDDLGHRPKLFVVGMDTWTFRPPREPKVFHGMRRRLLNTPQLAQHIDWVNPLSLNWCRFQDCFSQQHLQAGWQMLRHGVPREVYTPLAQSDYLNVDGTRVFYEDLYRSGGFGTNVFQEVEQGTYPITEVLNKKRWFTEWNYDFQELYPRRVDYLRRFLDLCHAHGVRVIVILGPVHPVFRAEISQTTRYLEHLDEIKALLAEQSKRLPGTVLHVGDMTSIDRFGGDPSGFYDELHPATRNCDLLLRQVAADIGELKLR